ncbi:MAG: MFS transporter, partial [Clostridia bacterium]|nr:MFS transporter [Clostridia bacterium]
MNMKHLKAMKGFLILLLTQTLSSLGSSMTSFALIVWSYNQEGSALQTALLSVCSYTPYVLMSVFAGTLSDRWNKKRVMLMCDAFAACSTGAVAVLLHTGRLEVWHLYALNAINGLMNTFQQPASDVASTLLTPKEGYQLASGLRSLAGSLCGIVSPAAATVLLTLMGMRAVIAFDLLTFAVASMSLIFLIRIPDVRGETQDRESVWTMMRGSFKFLMENAGILHLMLFLAAINLTASMYNAALPAMLISRSGEAALGTVRAFSGVAMVVGSLIASVMPEPKSRVRVICNTLMISMSTENFLLALGRCVPVWCAETVLGWIPVPMMNANMDVIFRTRIPVPMQGRVYAARNTFQFFTIPLGYFLGGALVDGVFEPYMAAIGAQHWMARLFGTGKGSGAAVLFFLLGILGVLTCLLFRRDRAIWALE